MFKKVSVFSAHIPFVSFVFKNKTYPKNIRGIRYSCSRIKRVQKTFGAFVLFVFKNKTCPKTFGAFGVFVFKNKTCPKKTFGAFVLFVFKNKTYPKKTFGAFGSFVFKNKTCPKDIRGIRVIQAQEKPRNRKIHQFPIPTIFVKFS